MSVLLSDAELDACREMAELAMPDTCTIQTRTETNAKGSVVVTYANTYTGVKCRIMPVNRSTTEYARGEKISDEALYVLTVPWDQAISPQDRVVCNGITYEITLVHANHAYRTARRAELSLVNQ